VSRRAAAYTQADIARALRAAEQAGPEWCVELFDGLIRLTRSPTKGPPADNDPKPTSTEPSALDSHGKVKWRL
jgi:hypothetical protein